MPDSLLLHQGEKRQKALLGPGLQLRPAQGTHDGKQPILAAGVPDRVGIQALSGRLGQ